MARHMSQGEDAADCLIVTPGFPQQTSSLLALLGSLTLNWPGHPPVLVYDLGLAPQTRRRLHEAGVAVAEVSPFCAHWRRHFAWRLWCLWQAPARHLLWLDADCLVLRPLDEVLAAARGTGYFFTTTHEPLEREASVEACAGCGLEPEFRRGKLALASGLMGFRKQGAVARLLEEAARVAQVESHLAPSDVGHRRSQAVLSLLAYKYLGELLLADGRVYHGEVWPAEVTGQKLWVHRHSLRPEDLAHLAAHIATPGPRFVPTPPVGPARARAIVHLSRVHRCFARGDRQEAAARLAAAFRIDPGLKGDAFGLAQALASDARRLQGFEQHRAEADAFLPWVVGTLSRLESPQFARMLSSQLLSETPFRNVVGTNAQQGGPR